MKSELDKLVIDVEFLLISVIQAVAFGTVATGAIAIYSKGDFQFLPYALTGLVFIMLFWSQAIMHVLGFIRWPLDMVHNFLYFVVSLVEVMMFAFMTDPFQWFLFAAIFSVLSGVLYFYDLRMIVRARPAITKSARGKILYGDLVKEQKRDLAVFVPGGIAFNAACAFLIRVYPAQFLHNRMHLILVLLQLVILIVMMAITLRSFKRRISFIEKL